MAGKSKRCLLPTRVLQISFCRRGAVCFAFQIVGGLGFEMRRPSVTCHSFLCGTHAPAAHSAGHLCVYSTEQVAAKAVHLVSTDASNSVQHVRWWTAAAPSWVLAGLCEALRIAPQTKMFTSKHQEATAGAPSGTQHRAF